MDNNTKQKLIQIAAVLVAILTFYFIASPYQMCLREGADAMTCLLHTAW
jgi:hypothetical protein